MVKLHSVTINHSYTCIPNRGTGRQRSPNKKYCAIKKDRKKGRRKEGRKEGRKERKQYSSKMSTYKN